MTGPGLGPSASLSPLSCRPHSGRCAVGCCGAEPQVWPARARGLGRQGTLRVVGSLSPAEVGLTAVGAASLLPAAPRPGSFPLWASVYPEGKEGTANRSLSRQEPRHQRPRWASHPSPMGQRGLSSGKEPTRHFCLGQSLRGEVRLRPPPRALDAVPLPLGGGSIVPAARSPISPAHSLPVSWLRGNRDCWPDSRCWPPSPLCPDVFKDIKK